MSPTESYSNENAKANSPIYLQISICSRFITQLITTLKHIVSYLTAQNFKRIGTASFLARLHSLIQANFLV